jgi:hypothetical protein
VKRFKQLLYAALKAFGRAMGNLSQTDRWSLAVGATNRIRRLPFLSRAMLAILHLPFCSGLRPDMIFSCRNSPRAFNAFIESPRCPL